MDKSVCGLYKSDSSEKGLVFDEVSYVKALKSVIKIIF